MLPVSQPRSTHWPSPTTANQHRPLRFDLSIFHNCFDSLLEHGCYCGSSGRGDCRSCSHNRRSQDDCEIQAQPPVPADGQRRKHHLVYRRHSYPSRTHCSIPRTPSTDLVVWYRFALSNEEKARLNLPTWHFLLAVDLALDGRDRRRCG